VPSKMLSPIWGMMTSTAMCLSSSQTLSDHPQTILRFSLAC
jgi:hypothetical protein